LRVHSETGAATLFRFMNAGRLTTNKHTRCLDK